MKRFLACILLVAPALAEAAPAPSEYLKVRAKRVTRVEGCDVDGIDGLVTLKFSLRQGRIHVSVPDKYKRQTPAIGAKENRYVACGTSASDPAKKVVFTNLTRGSIPTEHDIGLDDFEPAIDDGTPGDDGPSGVGTNTGGNLGAACKSVKPFPGSFIYKTIGSEHFTDARRNTIGLVMKPGANVATPGCIDVLAKNGAKISDLGFYSRGGGWFARYYGGIGCGDTVNGSALQSRATQASGSDDVYFRIGTTCYGPVDANRCIGSSQC